MKEVLYKFKNGEGDKQDFTLDSYFLYRASEIHFVLSMR